MNAFLRKLKLSFLAMLCGWIACNIAWWVGAIPLLSKPESSLRGTDLLMIGSFTAMVILITWLVIFLPTDLFVRDTATVRRPPIAALCGFLVSFTIVAGVFGYVAWFDGFWRTLDKSALPYALGTCATGTIAGYVRARLEKLSPHASS